MTDAKRHALLAAGVRMDAWSVRSGDYTLREITARTTTTEPEPVPERTDADLYAERVQADHERETAESTARQARFSRNRFAAFVVGNHRSQRT